MEALAYSAVTVAAVIVGAGALYGVRLMREIRAGRKPPPAQWAKLDDDDERAR